MAQVIAQRMTADVEGEVVVFLIGMRINRFWKIHKWLPVALAMPRMMRTLEADPAVGVPERRIVARQSDDHAAILEIVRRPRTLRQGPVG